MKKKSTARSKCCLSFPNNGRFCILSATEAGYKEPAYGVAFEEVSVCFTIVMICIQTSFFCVW